MHTQTHTHTHTHTHTQQEAKITHSKIISTTNSNKQTTKKKKEYTNNINSLSSICVVKQADTQIHNRYDFQS
jgi:hypothetical protein